MTTADITAVHPPGSAIAPYAGGQADEYRPRILMAPEDAKALDDQLRANTLAVLREGTDYGVIPGTGGEQTLFRPGAQKLLQWFGLGFTCDRIAIEYDDDGHREGVTYRCTVTKGLPDGRVIAVASCEGYAGYDEDRYYQSAEEAQRKAEEKERYFAQKDRRPPNPTRWQAVGAYRAPWNTVIKMCLAASTPLLIKSPYGEQLTEVTRLYSWLSRPTAPQVCVPGPDGEWVPVAGIFRNGVQPVLRITLRDGTEHRVTTAHRFLTSRGLVAAGDLSTGDTLVRRVIPLAGMKEPDPDFGWLVGLVIADGNVSRWGVRITLGQDEEQLAERAVWIGRRLGCHARYHKRPDMAAWLVTISGPAITGLLDQFITGKDSYGKHLRATAWRAGSDFLDGVLRGWLDGDGSWTERPGRLGHWRVGFTGHNDRWLRDLRVLGAILGYRVNVRTGTSKAGGKTFGTFVGDVKLPVSTRGNNADPGQVMSVEPDGETMTYDLEVGTADHLYLLHDGTVTHNSQKRAIVGAAKDATAASGLFGDDHDDTAAQDDRETAAPQDQDGGWPQGAAAARPRQDRTAEPEAARTWAERALEEAGTFSSEAEGGRLWRDAAAAGVDGRCTPGQATHIQNRITARITARRREASARILAEVAEDDPWRETISGLGDDEEARKALEELEELGATGKLDTDRARLLARAVIARYPRAALKDAPAAPEGPPEDQPGSISDAQLTKLHTVLTGLGYGSQDREKKLVIAEAITGRDPLHGPFPGRSSRNLSLSEARKLIDTLDGFGGDHDKLTDFMDQREQAGDGDD